MGAGNLISLSFWDIVSGYGFWGQQTRPSAPPPAAGRYRRIFHLSRFAYAHYDNLAALLHRRNDLPSQQRQRKGILDEQSILPLDADDPLPADDYPACAVSDI